MAKRLCAVVLSGWSVPVLSAVGLFTLLASSSADAAVGRTQGSFSVSANGAATYSIELFSPPGPRGLQPSVALTYNSNSEAGYLGVGWSLGGSFSSISRCKRNVAQDGYAGSVSLYTLDGFCLDGNRLRKQSGTYGEAGSVYYTEIANFSRVTASGTVGCGVQYWTVEGKDGLIYTYGGTSDSRPLLPGGCHYTQPSTVAEWMISEIRDRSGNKVKFTWKTTNATTYGTTHPVKIEWTQTSAGSGNYVYSMDFNYSAGGNAAASTPYRYAYARAVADSDLLTSITVSTSGTVKKNYVLTYETSTTTTAKRLTQVKECSDSGASDCLSPTTISYQDSTTGINTSSPLLNLSASVTAVEASKDFNGDGVLDIAYFTDAWYVRLGSVSSGYGSPVSTGIAGEALFARVLNTRADQLLGVSSGYWYVYGWNGSSFTATSTGIAAGAGEVFIDTDADGLDDVVYAGTPGTAIILTRFYYPTLSLSVLRNTSTSGSPSFASATSVSAGDWQPFETGYPWWWPGVTEGPSYAETSWYYGTEGWTWGFSIIGVSLSKAGNQNGDGRQGLNVQVDLQWCSYPPAPFVPDESIVGPCFDSAYTSEQRTIDFGSGTVSFNSYAASALVADFNGDGCDDSLLDDSWGTPYVGISGCGGATVGAYLASYGYGTGIGAMDWNGDGNADVFQWDGTNIYVRSVLGGALNTAVNTGLPSTCQIMYRTDGNADGLDDLVCLDPGNSLKVYPHNGASLAPDLVASVVDGFGVTHTPLYTRIEKGNYSAYNDAVYPARDVTRGRYVVKKVTASDGIGGTFDTDYTYFGAQVNVQGRGFAGFDKIQSVDSRNGIMREQKFKREFPYGGSPYEVSVKQSVSGALMNKRTVTMAYDTLDATAYNQRYFTYTSATTEEAYEVGGAGDGLLIKESTTSSTYDAWGNLTASSTTVTDKDASSPLLNKTWTAATTATISPSTTYWCLGLPSATTLTQSSSVSGETTVYESKGYSPDYVNCRNDAETVGTGALQVTTNYTYGDSFGNVTGVSVTGRNLTNTGDLTARTAIISWGTTGQFPVSETNALSQTTTRTFHATFGSLLTQTDPNSIVVADNEYDAFGRITRSIRPDGTATRMTYAACATYGCENGDPASGATGINKTIVIASERNTSDAQIRDSWTYLDLFDRPIVQKALTVTGGYSRSGTQYDNQGRVDRQTAPCDASSCTAYWITNDYDLVGRPTSQSRPESQTSSTPVTTTLQYVGRTQIVTDAKGKVTTKILDVKGQLRLSRDHDNYSQSFAYDSAGSVTQVTDSLSNTLFSATYSYGIRPFQTATTDMDLGAWTYQYNSLGELVEWTDAKSQTFYQDYDALSRVTSRTEPDAATTWTWGTSAGSKNIGRLASVSMSGYSEALSYDSIGRPSTRSITTDQTYDIDYAYTNQGLVDTVTYPTSTSSTRVKVKYGYDYGILKSVTDWTTGSAGTVYWTANAQNARGQTTQETLGNGVVTTRAFDAVTGWLTALRSGPDIYNHTLQNQSYLYDFVGNVTQRQEATQNLTESFYYDNLHRLDYSTLDQGSGAATNLNLTYDVMGNITARTDVNSNNTWTYHSTKKHAVATTGSGGVSYSYDANGNMTTRGTGNTITWSSYNYATGLATATESTQFYYGPNRQYYKQVYTGPSGNETTHYVGGILEKVYDGSVTDWRHNIVAEGQVVAIVSRKSTSANAVFYPLEDAQGSGSTLTDASGTNLVRQSYNAFGLPRDGSDWDGAVSSGDMAVIKGISRRGYTGHSMLGDMGLIHMNGRVQDAITGRFLSPDPNVPQPGNTQSYNRYAYVRNNPMSMIDPSGFFEEFQIAGMGWMGTSASLMEYASQLLEYCGIASESGGDLPQPCGSQWVGQMAEWLQEYGMYVGNANAMNAQMAGIDQAYLEQLERVQHLEMEGDPKKGDGPDAVVEGPRYPGITRCGDSLCGNVAYDCGRNPAAKCAAVVDHLRNFVQANGFNITFSHATTRELDARTLRFGDSKILQIGFGEPYFHAKTGNPVYGDYQAQRLNVFGDLWSRGYPVAEHEFGHALGLGHNTTRGSLMYSGGVRGADILLRPAERQSLLKAYGP